MDHRDPRILLVLRACHPSVVYQRENLLALLRAVENRDDGRVFGTDVDAREVAVRVGIPRRLVDGSVQRNEVQRDARVGCPRRRVPVRHRFALRLGGVEDPSSLDVGFIDALNDQSR